jgi:MFS family permease
MVQIGVNLVVPSGVWASYRALDSRIRLLALARCINTMGFSLVMPFMALYLTKRTGKAVSYGAIYFVASLAAALTQGLAGELADRYGRRRLMVTALGLRTFNMMALGVAVLSQAPIPTLAALIIVNGMLRALFEPAASASVTELSPPDRRVAAFGLQRMGVNLGWSLGPVIGGMLAAHSYGTMFFVAAPATLLAAVAAGRVHDIPRAPGEGPPRETLRSMLGGLSGNRPFLLYLVLVFLSSTMTVQIFSTLSVFLGTKLGFSEGHIGALYMVNGVLVVLFQVPAVMFIERRGLRLSLVLGPLFYTLAYVGLGLTSTYAHLILLMAVVTAGEVMFSPALSDMAADLGDPKRPGRSFGLFGLMQQLGVAMGPLVGSAAYDQLGGSALGMWGALAAGMATVGVSYLAFGIRYRELIKS